MNHPKFIRYYEFVESMKYSPEDRIKKKSTITLPFQCEAEAEIQIIKFSDEEKQEKLGLVTQCMFVDLISTNAYKQ